MTLTLESALRKDKRNASRTIGGMQHRHFAIIAGIIAQMEPEARARVAREFAAKLAPTNPRFDRKRFLMACEV